MIRIERVGTLLLVCLLGAGCAGSASSRASAAAPAPSRRSGNVLTADDLVGKPYQTLYDAIRALHPGWLRPANAAMTSAGGVERKVGVFYAGQRADQGIDHLATLTPDAVGEVRYLGPTQALATYGTEFQYGAIVLTRK